MITELAFTFNEGFKYKEGLFKVDNLVVYDTSDNFIVDYDGIELYLDGTPYKGDIDTWATKGVSAEWLFDQVLDAYFRDDTHSYSHFSEEWNVFNEITEMAEVKDGLVMVLPVCEGGSIEMYELDLATPALRYYCGNDSYLMIRADSGEIVTDMENFYTEGMIEDLCDIIRGDVECLYMGYNPKEFIKEMGGEEAFLEEFDE